MDASTASLAASKRRELLSLDTQKAALETEAEAIVSELTAELPDGGPPMGIDTPLVDSEGYPRGDIDVFRARTLRRRFIEIQNDHKAVMAKIEKGLAELQLVVNSSKQSDESTEKALRTAPKPKPKFDPVTNQWVVKSWDGSVAGITDGEGRQFDDLLANAAAGDDGGGVGGAADIAARSSSNSTVNASSVNATTTTNSNSTSTPTTQILTPFAIIDQVSPSSPASTAGIQLNDLLLQFDNIDHTNHENFSGIAKLVQEKEGRSINVKVRRCKVVEWGEVSEVLELELMPRKWSGRGLLGCHISKYDE
ncbi:hypothetical protein ACHAXN_011086 [Cyclotella atomus]